MMNWEKIKRYFNRFLGRNVYPSVKEYELGGVKIGNNVDILCSSIDMLIPELLSIGDNVTITHATILTHDASTKKMLGYTKFGSVYIGNNVFIGSGAVILPDTKIGDKVIVGAGAVVASDIPSNSVCVGSPARVIMSYDEYLRKMNLELSNSLVLDKYPFCLSKSEREAIVQNTTENKMVFMY